MTQYSSWMFWRLSSPDFGFWILDWLRPLNAELGIRQLFLRIAFEKGGFKPLFSIVNYEGVEMSAAIAYMPDCGLDSNSDRS
jgi:hypothetical protein